MRRIAACILFFVSLYAGAQNSDYWQQEVNYRIDVTLNDRNQSLSGREVIEYINHSPDQLEFIWFHLWPNAYRNEQTAFAEQVLREKDGKKRWNSLRVKGYIDSLDFHVNGTRASLEAHPQYIDVVKLLLPEPLAPGGRIMIETGFYVKLPSYISRSGFEGSSYMICQWYPKPAVYDRKGWHPMPYLDKGEFYSEFGSFDVSVTVPSGYIIAATGELQDTVELRKYREAGMQNVLKKSRKGTAKYIPPAGAVKTLRYTAENIHDFAWFANPSYVIRYDTLQQPSRTVDVFAFHHPGGNPNWTSSISYIKDGTRAFSVYVGEYPYPVVQAVEGPKNDMSGGMEYPMVTLITMPDAKGEMLDAVITHEVGHNWFQGILASNERLHAWMDEGINSYYQFRYEAEKYRFNSVFGDAVPSELKKMTPDLFQANVYSVLARIPMEEKIDLPAVEYKNEDEYGLVTYVKTAIWMYLMELELGRENLDKAIQAYFNDWKFRHPYPEDLKASMEKSIGKDLTSYFDLLYKKGNL